MKQKYLTPQVSVVDVPCESIMLTNSQGQTGGTIPDMGWGDNGGNTGGTIPGMGWGASEKRNGWDEYENE